ncbi:MAG: hypothetical protein IT287_08690 [Bdellovibrionaceae bacterium]|nr:hypothetical protein [Pseudobdellovibrionaceae bacterium]
MSAEKDNIQSAKANLTLSYSSKQSKTESMIFYMITGMTVFFFIAYAVIAILFPEWVGITGKKAQQIEAEQRETDPTKKT